MIAHLSDGSAPDYSDSTLTNNAGKTTLQEYTFTYNAASPGQTLTITFTEASQTTSTDSGNVALQSATLAGGVVAPDFTVSATPSSRSVTAGGSTTYTVGVTALNGFAGSVGFSVSGMPSGVTAAFSPAAATGSGSSTMTLTTATRTAAGTYPLTVKATSGSLVHTANVSLTVTGAADFSLGATPSSRSVVAGTSASYTMSVTALNGFANFSGFSVTGLPAGVTAAFSPAAVTGSGSSTMTLTSTTGKAAGTIPLPSRQPRDTGPYRQCESDRDRRRGLFVVERRCRTGR